MKIDWQAVNGVAQSLSAAGTLVAVVVSLHLARQQRRSLLRLRATVVRILTQGDPSGDYGTFLSIEAANAGFQDVTVTSLGWRVGVFRPAYLIQTTSMHPLSASLPKKLAASEVAHFLFPWERFLENATPLAEAIEKPWRAFRSQFVWVFVTLSTGEIHRTRLEPALVRRISRARVESASPTGL